MNTIFTQGAPLPRLQQFLAGAVREFYFDSVSLHTPEGHEAAPLTGGGVPTILLVSHRNGAIDGYVTQKLHPTAISMVSVQLVTHPLLRFFFSGIPVLRDKDRERYGERAAAIGNPVMNAIRHVEAGGSLCVYPEGSSEWGYTHLPYQPGGAKIIRHLLQKSVPFEVRAVGLFYTEPDTFRSSVDLIVSDPITIAARQEGDSAKTWEQRIFTQVNEALDHVSVHCRDNTHFVTVEQYARTLFEQAHYENSQGTTGGSYGATFIATQQQETVPPLPQDGHRPWTFRKTAGFGLELIVVALFLLVVAPVLLAGYIGGRFADARNTVTFFRVMAGTPAGILWMIALLFISLMTAFTVLLLPVMALVGLPCYARVRYVFRRGNRP